MGLEIATHISDLVTTNPTSGDQENQGDDHLRLLKAVLKTSFPNASRPEYFQTAVATSSNVVAVEADDKKVYAVNTSGGDKTFTLPSLTANNGGWEVSVCKVTTDLNDVTISPASGTISGLASIVLHSPFQLMSFIWTGSIWTVKFGRLPPFKPLSYSVDTTLTNLAYGSIVTGITSGGAVILTLPTAVGNLGESILFRRSGANDLTLDGSGTETINGATTYVLPTNLAMAWLVSDGANWMLLATQTGSTGAPAFTNVAQSFLAAQTFDDQVIFGQQTLADAPTVVWDMGGKPSALFTETASRTLGAPDNEVAGQFGFFLVTQNATGGWVLTLNAAYKTSGGGDIRPGVGVSEATLYMYYVRGTDDVLLWKIWSSARNSIGFYKEYDLGGNFASARRIITPHLLGRLPSLVQLFFVCTSTDLGFAVGDYVESSRVTRTGDPNGVVTVLMNTTNVVVLFDSENWRMYSNVASPLASTIDNTKWKPVLLIYE